VRRTAAGAGARGLIAGDDGPRSAEGADAFTAGDELPFGLTGFGANLGRVTDGAPPAASSRGCVTVAANARLRAAAQSLHSFVPVGVVQPQMRHFIRELPSQQPGSNPLPGGFTSI